jgi:hypothetical protein
MASEARTIELADVGDLGTLVDEVRRSRRPRILQRDGEDVAVLIPTVSTRGRGSRPAHPRPPTPAQVERSRAGIKGGAGSWQSVDAEALKEELRRQRDIVTRPPVEL